MPKKGMSYMESNLPPYPVQQAELWDGVTYFAKAAPWPYTGRNLLTPSNSTLRATPVVGPGTAWWMGLTLQQLNFAFWRVDKWRQDITSTISASVNGETASTTFPTNLATGSRLDATIANNKKSESRALLNGSRWPKAGTQAALGELMRVDTTATEAVAGSPGTYVQRLGVRGWWRSSASTIFGTNRQTIRYCPTSKLYYIRMPELTIDMTGVMHTAPVQTVKASKYWDDLTQAWVAEDVTQLTFSPGEYLLAYSQHRLVTYPAEYIVPSGVTSNPLAHLDPTNDSVPFGSSGRYSLPWSPYYESTFQTIPAAGEWQLNFNRATHSYTQDTTSLTLVVAKGTPYQKTFAVPCIALKKFAADSPSSTRVRYIRPRNLAYYEPDAPAPPGLTGRLNDQSVTAVLAPFDTFDCLTNITRTVTVELTPTAYYTYGGAYDGTTGEIILPDPPTP